MTRPERPDTHAHNDPDTELCTYCPKLCRHACPVSAADPRESLITQQKMQRLGDLRTGRVAWSEENAAPIYACTGCGQCTTYCAHEVPVGHTLFEARADLAGNGVKSAAVANLVPRHAARDRALVAALRGRFKTTDFAAPGAEIGFLPGCDACGSEDGLGDVAAALELFRALGSPVGLVNLDGGGVLCGGQPLAAGGEREALRSVAERQAAQLASYRVVIMSCPGCVMLMRQHYRELGVELAPKIVHFAEHLEPYADRLRALVAKGAVGGKVHYHDPCHLGRGLGVYEAPRQLLASAGLEPTEFEWSRRDSQCSGGGGLLPITMPETSRAMARRRLDEVTGGEAPVRVVTACPTCKRSLGRAAKAQTQVQDLASVLLAALRET